jgi:hypothetical protein
VEEEDFAISNNPRISGEVLERRRENDIATPWSSSRERSRALECDLILGFQVQVIVTKTK